VGLIFGRLIAGGPGADSPDTNGDCESRTPPVAVDPSTLP
jgi:hypothetical protein